MFSSNQILEISGPINSEEYLLNALEFALKASGNLSSFENETKADIKCVYQISKDGSYCIGKAYGEPKEGWSEYPFDFDLNIIAQIIIKHLSKQDIEYEGADGGYEKGFVMKAIEKVFDYEKTGIKEPFYGIVKFEPFTCFYHK